MNLKERVVKSGLKQIKIAEAIGITPEYLNQMLNGKATMSDEIERKIKDVLSKVII